MNKKSISIIAIAAIILIAVSIAGAVMLNQGQSGANPTPSPSPTGTAPLVTLTDNTGHTLNLTKYPERIVSLAPANTQILFAIGAGDKVVGVTDFDKYPYNFTAWIKDYHNMTSIGKYYNPAVEPIIALNPDLIVAAQGSADQAVQLADLGYNVITLYPTKLSEVLDNIVLVGKATNHQADAEALVSSLQQRINVVANGVATATTKPKVYVEVYSTPYTSVGKDTFIDELVKLAGGQNIYENATTDYPEVGSETTIALNPDIIVFPDSMGVDLTAAYAEVSGRDGWNAVTAVKNNEVFIVKSDALNQPGPRLVEALENLAKIIHPEIFGTYTYQP